MKALRIAMLMGLLVALVGVAGSLRAGPLDAELRVAALAARIGGKSIGPRVARRVMKQLDLSPRQRRHAWAVIDRHAPRLDALRAELQAGSLDLLELDPSREDYPALVEASARRTGERVEELVLLMGRVHVELDAILTDRQRREAQRMTAELRGQFEKLAESFGSRSAPASVSSLARGRSRAQ